METQTFESDILPTSAGDLRITFLGHGSLLFFFNDFHIYVDPFSQTVNYSKLPGADVILLTHEHHDHMDPGTISQIQTRRTVIIMTRACAQQMPAGMVLRNGDAVVVMGIRIQAVPAYNLVHLRENGQPFHPRGAGNGYVLTFGDQHVYVAGDTENIPEMRNLREITCAFLPMNLPYTMTPEMAADAARMIHPAILYPYHYGETDTSRLVELLKADRDIEVRVRKMS
jgi:L-ascorbate metabolism protein UlaG (beta-lactamase superfamily)